MRSRSRSRPSRKESSFRRSRSDDSTSSRERERKRRKSQHVFLAKNQRGKQAPGADASMFWDGFQWIPRAVGQNSQEHNATRKNRRLYCANLPTHLGLSEEMLGQQMFVQMREKGLIARDATNPVLHVWFARDKGGNYGFVEFATLEDTERALSLDGFMVLGAPIAVKRPSDYSLPVLPPGMTIGGPALPAASESKPSSRIVRFPRVFAVSDNTEADEFLDVIDDMRDLLAKTGIKAVKILMARGDIGDEPSGGWGLTAGDALFEFRDLDGADACFKAVKGRKYDGKPVKPASVDEAHWLRELLPILLEMNADVQ